jgi:energy-coupling factor transporter transmembrane protein EcfT
MSIPPSGIAFAPLGLAIFFFAPQRLGQASIVAAVFAAASVLNFGGGTFPVGIAPFYFIALLIAIRSIPKWLNGGLKIPMSGPLRHHLQAVTAFVGWAALSALLLPILFRGLPVDLGRAGPDATYYTRLPLHWSLSNAGQAGYLLLDLIVVFYLLERTQTAADLGTLCSSFSLSGMIVVAVGSYQFTAHHFGLPFPRELFNSNPAWAQLTSQDLNGASRISATFDESSGAGSFLAAWLTFELVIAGLHDVHRWKHLVLALAGIVMVIGTTSTTGYVTTSIMLLFILVHQFFDLSRKGGSALIVVIVGLFALATVSACLLTDEGYSLLCDVLLDKAQSGSSLHRMATVMRSFDTFMGTYGLGAGLGSDRAMSMPAYILSNLGVAGALLFAWLMVSLVTMSHVVRGKVSSEASAGIWHRAFGMAFAAHLLALTESGAEISDPILWLLWAILLASIRQRWPAAQAFPSMTPNEVHSVNSYAASLKPFYRPG